jgi:hypothetical protein
VPTSVVCVGAGAEVGPAAAVLWVGAGAAIVGVPFARGAFDATDAVCVGGTLPFDGVAGAATLVAIGSSFFTLLAGSAGLASVFFTGGGGALGSKNLAGTPCAAKDPLPTHAPTRRLHLYSPRCSFCISLYA